MLAPVVEIFCEIDDYCKEFFKGSCPKVLPNPHRQRKRACRLSASEIMTITVLFHWSQYRTFKAFYLESVVPFLRAYFPNLTSYNRFLELQQTIMTPLTGYLLSKRGETTGLYYVDSTPLKVCHNRRIYKHKVFAGIAKRGKHSMGWFFGFKLHLSINHKGELMNFCITTGHVDDRQVLIHLFKHLKGLGAGDRGYISDEKQATLAEKGLRFITKIKKNMKEKTLTFFEKKFLSKRGIIETVIEQLKSICQIEHSRHRSPMNFLSNLLAALAAYVLKPRKPSVNFGRTPNSNTILISS